MSPEGAVVATVNRFHLSVDRHDWATARSCLAEVVRLAEGGGEDEGQELPADRFLGTIRSNVEAFASTQHLVAGHHVLLDADATARCRASFQYHYVSGVGRWVLGGQQEVRLRRVGDAWRITAVALSKAWEEGNPPVRHP